MGDGVAVFTSSAKDVWPIFLQINELTHFLRYIICIEIIKKNKKYDHCWVVVWKPSSNEHIYATC